MNPCINLPIRIVTKKIARNKTNSVFYAGHNIADIRIFNRVYVLTTSGEYNFTTKEGGKIISNNWVHDTPIHFIRTVKTLTDTKIKKIDDEGLVSNWGWFGLNVWVDGVCQPDPIEVWSTYDEAMEEFVKYIVKDINRGY